MFFISVLAIWNNIEGQQLKDELGCGGVRVPDYQGHVDVKHVGVQKPSQLLLQSVIFRFLFLIASICLAQAKQNKYKDMDMRVRYILSRYKGSVSENRAEICKEERAEERKVEKVEKGAMAIWPRTRRRWRRRG